MCEDSNIYYLNEYERDQKVVEDSQQYQDMLEEMYTDVDEVLNALIGGPISFPEKYNTYESKKFLYDMTMLNISHALRNKDFYLAGQIIGGYFNECMEVRARESL